MARCQRCSVVCIVPRDGCCLDWEGSGTQEGWEPGAGSRDERQQVPRTKQPLLSSTEQASLLPKRDLTSQWCPSEGSLCPGSCRLLNRENQTKAGARILDREPVQPGQGARPRGGSGASWAMSTGANEGQRRAEAHTGAAGQQDGDAGAAFVSGQHGTGGAPETGLQWWGAVQVGLAASTPGAVARTKENVASGGLTLNPGLGESS